MNFVMRERGVFIMWSDEKDELIQQIREELTDILLYLITWTVLFMIIWEVIF